MPSVNLALNRKKGKKILQLALYWFLLFIRRAEECGGMNRKTAEIIMG